MSFLFWVFPFGPYGFWVFLSTWVSSTGVWYMWQVSLARNAQCMGWCVQFFGCHNRFCECVAIPMTFKWFVYYVNDHYVNAYLQLCMKTISINETTYIFATISNMCWQLYISLRVHYSHVVPLMLTYNILIPFPSYQKPIQRIAEQRRYIFSVNRPMGVYMCIVAFIVITYT